MLELILAAIIGHTLLFSGRRLKASIIKNSRDRPYLRRRLSLLAAAVGLLPFWLWWHPFLVDSSGQVKNFYDLLPDPLVYITTGGFLLSTLLILTRNFTVNRSAVVIYALTIVIFWNTILTSIDSNAHFTNNMLWGLGYALFSPLIGLATYSLVWQSYGTAD